MNGPRALLLLPLALLLALAPLDRVSAQELTEAPGVVLGGIPFALGLSGEAGAPFQVTDAGGRLLAEGVLGEDGTAAVADLVVEDGGALPLAVTIGAAPALALAPTLIPGWFSLLPPLLAVLIALVFREVISALVAGIWLGALAYAGFDPIQATWRMLDAFIIPALADADHATIIAFSLLLGGLVGLVSRNGGTAGVVAAVIPWASTPRRGKLATAAAGFAIFFDDYANTLIVGNTMRPITDRLKISREKLAYLVDSTAAPVAALVPISTWVGYEISLIQGGLEAAALQNPELAAELTATSPFGVFLHTIPYLFYPLLAIAFVLLTSAMNRDFGAMARAEERAATGGGLHRPGAQLTTDTEAEAMESKPGIPARWWNAAVPVFTTVAVVLGGLWSTGSAAVGPGASAMDIFGAADPFAPLLWGSFSGCLVAIVMSIGQRLLTMNEAVEAFLGGMKAMMVAMTVLTLAWALGAVTQEVGAAAYLTQIVEGNLPLELLPVVVFVTAAAMAFATGTSWTTMAILIPLVIPLTVSLGGAMDFDGGTHYSILLGAISSVLAGAIFGDHCSPISDTTVLSSTAAACDHVDHVRTQLPYALVVAVVSMTLGDIATAYGLPNWIALVGGVALLFGFLRFFGRPTPHAHVDPVTGAA